ncbi:hypothetical protein BH18ACT1_BH18ACT1_05210 [soil metagenome]
MRADGVALNGLRQVTEVDVVVTGGGGGLALRRHVGVN